MELTAHLAALAAQESVRPDRRSASWAAAATTISSRRSSTHVAARGEFYTAYTPYQAEASQGNLQVFFEYQTLISQLTGMDVSNASLYDGGSAVAEAVLMACSVTGRHGRVVAAESVHPEYRADPRRRIWPTSAPSSSRSARPSGTIDPQELARRGRPTRRPACSCSIRISSAASKTSRRWPRSRTTRARCSSSAVDPISLGLLKRPGDYGADIVVAEGQSLGKPMSFGGPYLGIMACREQFVRRMPGRIVGQTVDRRGKRCWVLTLQTREQHIRREKATSNICTNQGLFALRATVYLAAHGPAGPARDGRAVPAKGALRGRAACRRRAAVAGVRAAVLQGVRRSRPRRTTSTELLADAATAGYLAGVPLGRWYPRAGRLLPGRRDREADQATRSTAWPRRLSKHCSRLTRRAVT